MVHLHAMCCSCIAYLLELLAFVVVLAKTGHSSLQSLPGHTLASTCLAHNHVAMTCHLTVKDLDDLGDKLRHHLQSTQTLNDTACSSALCHQKQLWLQLYIAAKPRAAKTTQRANHVV